MKVTITEYGQLPNDLDSLNLQLGGLPKASQVLTAAGSAVALADDTRYIRVATDTAIHLKQGVGVTTADPYMPAGSVEYFGAHELTVISIILG